MSKSQSLEKIFSEVLSRTVTRVTRVFGGDVNETYRLDIKNDSNDNDKQNNNNNNNNETNNNIIYFLKLQRGASVDFYASETEGLRLLSSVARTPQIIKVGEINGNAYLIMEFIPKTPIDINNLKISGNRRNDIVALGKMLAKVHQKRSPNGQFGSDVPITLGECQTPAGWCVDWPTYYIKMRLEPQIALARRKGLWNKKRDEMFHQFSLQFYKFYSSKREVIPSLLHGDLWGGNVMYGVEGEPYLIDPSSYYGNREVDIAMTRLFGGFGSEFYKAYEGEFPLEEGHLTRVPWYQLLPLICHLNLFGEGYGSSVEAALTHV